MRRTELATRSLLLVPPAGRPKSREAAAAVGERRARNSGSARSRLWMRCGCSGGTYGRETGACGLAWWRRSRCWWARRC
jgi:hypothetical protein